MTEAVIFRMVVHNKYFLKLEFLKLNAFMNTIL